MSKNLRKTLYLGLATLMIGGITNFANLSANAATNQTEPVANKQAAPSNQPNAKPADNSQNNQPGQGKQQLNLSTVKSKIKTIKKNIKIFKILKKNGPIYKKNLRNGTRIINQQIALLKSRRLNSKQSQFMKKAVKENKAKMIQLKQLTTEAKVAPKALKSAPQALKQLSMIEGLLSHKNSKANQSPEQQSSKNSGKPMSSNATSQPKLQKETPKGHKTTRIKIKKAKQKSRSDSYQRGYSNGFKSGYHKYNKILKRLMRKTHSKNAINHKLITIPLKYRHIWFYRHGASSMTYNLKKHYGYYATNHSHEIRYRYVHLKHRWYGVKDSSQRTDNQTPSFRVTGHYLRVRNQIEPNGQRASVNFKRISLNQNRN